MSEAAKQSSSRFLGSGLLRGFYHRARIRTTRWLAMTNRSALLLGDDLVLDLVVGCLRHDLLLDQLILTLVGAALDDGCRIGLADPRERVEFFGAGGIDVEQVGLGGRHLRSRRHLRI